MYVVPTLFNTDKIMWGEGGSNPANMFSITKN